jgi:cobalt-zinc-cadmium efflux system protein
MAEPLSDHCHTDSLHVHHHADDHVHDGHHHGAEVVHSPQKLRSLWVAIALMGIFASVEVAIALMSHSLALLAESVHMVSDAAALGIALLAAWLSQRPASNQATFGYRRFEILAALVNGVGLVGIALWIGREAIAHLQSPPDAILSQPMLFAALLGFGVNTVNASLLHTHSHGDLNVRAAFLHMVADAASSVGVVLAAIAVWQWHWLQADSLVSLAIAGLIVTGAMPLIRQSADILLEKVPTHLDVEAIRGHLLTTDGVRAVVDLHVWAIAPGQEALMADLQIDEMSSEMRDRLLAVLKESLRKTFQLSTVYLQMTSGTPHSVVNFSSLDAAHPSVAESITESSGFAMQEGIQAPMQ